MTRARFRPIVGTEAAKKLRGELSNPLVRAAGRWIFFLASSVRLSVLGMGTACERDCRQVGCGCDRACGGGWLPVTDAALCGSAAAINCAHAVVRFPTTAFVINVFR